MFFYKAKKNYNLLKSRELYFSITRAPDESNNYSGDVPQIVVS